MSKIMEKPFEHLRRKKDGKEFEKEIIKGWYIARAYIQERLKDVSFKPNSVGHLHVAIEGDSPLMLCLVRQVALSAHYINHHEKIEDESCRNRTVITLVSNKPDIKSVLEREEYLFNLPKYCKYREGTLQPENSDSYIDLEIHVVPFFSDDEKAKCDYVFNEEDVESLCKQKAAEGMDIFSIDTRKAIYVNRIYNLGTVIDNLPSEDIHSTSRYMLALDVFQYNKLRKAPQPLMNENSWKNQRKVRECISNIFCSDCFESRYKSIMLCGNGDSASEKELWEKNNKALSESEHSRWVVEKLILGYSPLNKLQRFKDESLFNDKKSLYRKALMNDFTHIDLCSYADLRRINPADLKYDSFMMLAIPKILEKIKRDEKR